MKKFIKKLSLFGIILISVVLFCVIINKIIILQNDLLTLESHKKILILGASRTECAINDKMTTNAYNISGAGDPLFYSLIKLREFKKANPGIEKVILSLDSRTLNTKIVTRFYRPASMESKLPRYIHFLSKNDWLFLFKINFYATLKSSFFTPQYTARLIKRSILDNNDKNKQLQMGGYKKINYTYNNEENKNSKYNRSSTKYLLSNMEILNLMKITEYCKENNLELIFINPPIHRKILQSKEYQEGQKVFQNFYVENLNNHLFLDYSDYELPDDCYADLVHLNSHGANIFTEKLAKDLKLN